MPPPVSTTVTGRYRTGPTPETVTGRYSHPKKSHHMCDGKRSKKGILILT
jgi:hypothetical protein